jgi:hypothetical protein
MSDIEHESFNTLSYEDLIKLLCYGEICCEDVDAICKCIISKPSSEKHWSNLTKKNKFCNS